MTIKVEPEELEKLNPHQGDNVKPESYNSQREADAEQKPSGSEQKPSGSGNRDANSSVSEENLAEAVDELQQKLGGYGRFQILIYIVLGLFYMRGGWHVFIPIYQGWDPGHHCSASPGLSLNESVPGKVEDDIWVWNQCLQYVNKSVNNDTKPCQNGWTYLWNSSYTSIVSEFDLVCDDEYLNELTTTMYMVGTTCGVVFLTPLSDRLGAKTVVLACLWVQAVIGTCLIWAGNIVVFCILKVLIGMCNMTIALGVYVLMTETFDAAHRELPTIAMQFFWAAGIMTMALFGYLIPKWQDLELTIALPINALSVVCIFIIPESLPWLLSKGKVHKAEAVIKRFLKINQLPAIEDLQSKLSKFKLSNPEKSEASKKKRAFSNPGYSSNEGENGTQGKERNYKSDDNSKVDEEGNAAPVYTVLTLFKTRRLRMNSLVMFYLFLVNALAYFGIMYSTPELDGDRFLNLFLLGVVEIPAYILCLLSNRYIGRRRSISIFLLICAASNLAVPFISDESDDGTDLTKLKTALVIIGKFGITGSYSAIYLYASEIYPTILRNQALGASSFFENIGSIAAPNMVYVNDSTANLSLGIFGGMTVIGCVLVLLLPETHNRPLPQTIADVEDWHDEQNNKSNFYSVDTAEKQASSAL